MRQSVRLLAAALAAAVAFAPGLAAARAGGGSSFGSRGMRTYSAPAPTRTAPYAAPMQRSMTPRSNPAPGFGAPAYRAPAYPSGGFGARSGFASGFLGGLIGAGIGGLLLGRGLFGGIGGAGGFLGLLLQIAIIVLVVRWLLRLFANRQEAFAGPGAYARQGAPAMPVPGPGGSPGVGPPVTITRADFQQFEQILQRVQGAWTAQDMRGLQALCTPEMVSYFGDELSEQASRGVRNSVTEIRLEQGDLSESWSEGTREYATVAMRFSMLDVTRDGAGRVVEGSDSVRTLATEFWTFLRAPGGRWLLSAIQQSGTT